MLDQNGYRPNVGIVLCNHQNKVFWACRCGQRGWQFPQGGINHKESPETAMFRELHEEVGLHAHHVDILGRTQEWLYYDLPKQFLRNQQGKSKFRGQKQIWYLLRLTGEESDFNLGCSDRPEFDDWCWLDYWEPLERVIEFKRAVYEQALGELQKLLETNQEKMKS